MDAFIYSYLAWLLVPLWLGAGFADWLCHRKERIELTAGTRESVLHLLMLLEIGIPVLYCLFFDINAMAILICLVGWLCHEITTWLDVRYAFNHRRIGPTEQHVHGFLELLPVLALSLVIILHPDQFLALLGMGERTANFAVKLKTPWPYEYVAMLIGAVLMFLIIPFAEELWRCVRVERRTRVAA